MKGLHWTKEDLEAFQERTSKWRSVGVVRVHQIRDEPDQAKKADPNRNRAKPLKYGNHPTNGFASKKEADRFQQLVLLEKSGAIRDLKTQVTFKMTINGVVICKYVADFTYVEEGHFVVEDSKGYETREFKIKRKLLKALHGHELRTT